MTRQAKGAKSTLVLAYESTYGTTPESPTGIKLPFNKLSLAGKQGLIESNTITGRRDPSVAGRGLIDTTGSAEVPIDVRALGYWLTMMFNAPTTGDASIAGKLTGASGVTTTIATWTAVTNGAFKVAIDGSAATAVSGIDFSSGVTTMANVASKIQAAVRAIGTGGFTNATVAWDETNTRFVITSGTTGDSSSVSQLTAPASGTDISGTGFMKCTAGTLTAGDTLYQHVFKIGDEMPSASIEKGFTDISQYALYPGCKASKWAFSAQVGNNEQVTTIDLMGATESIATASIDASPSEPVLSKFNSFNATVQEAGSTLGTCRKFDLSVDFGLDGDTYCLNGEGSRTDISEGLVQISGSIETLFKDATLLNKAINGTETSLKAIFASGNYSLEVSLPELIFDRGTPAIDGPKGLVLTSSFRAHYADNADSTAIKVTLVNDVASYAIA